MKQAIAWTILVILGLICIGISLTSFAVSQESARQLGAVQAQGKKTERTVQELTERIAQLRNDLAKSTHGLPADVPATETAWTTSADGQVQVKLTAERDVSNTGQPMTLLITVRNSHHSPLTIDAPIFDPWDIDLSHDGQRVRYVGPVPDPALPQPITLQPGEIARYPLELTTQKFPALVHEGAFQVEFTYRSGFQNTWKGTIGPLMARWVNQ